MAITYNNPFVTPRRLQATITAALRIEQEYRVVGRLEDAEAARRQVELLRSKLKELEAEQ